MHQSPPARIESLDLIRGVAVLGILAINLAGFAGPPLATLSPQVPHAATPADEWAFAAMFVLFEGKMRALFSLLFGASMVLFIERTDAAGGYGEVKQLRRLGWLALFGLAHYFLFWWGDILFLYALAGTIALFMRELPVRRLAGIALAVFLLWHAIGVAGEATNVLAEERVRIGVASSAETDLHGKAMDNFRKRLTSDMADRHRGFGEMIVEKLENRALAPLTTALTTLGETLPLMLLGMALYRTGFFSGAWSKRRLRGMALGGIGLGGAATLTALAWLWPRDFPLQAMWAAVSYGLALPHLAMAMGYAALLALAAPRLLATRIGHRFAAAGRVAFSNYLGTSIVMTAVFSGWGLGLFARYGHAGQLPFLFAAWAAMLLWSQAWLARYRQGPLEWLWRSLTERRMIALRR